MKIVRILTGIMAMVAMVVFTACEEENLDQTEVTVTYDCPSIEANFGDVCFSIDSSNANTVQYGNLNQNCECIISDSLIYDCPNLSANIGDPCQNGWGTISSDCDCLENTSSWDCPVWELNIGDSCADGTDINGNLLVEGILDANCNCIEEFDCPGLMGNIGDPCQGGWGIISADCDCVENSIWDCPDLQMNIGDSCYIDGFPYGAVSPDCECPLPSYTIDGRWLWSPSPNSADANTMYEFINGVRYTYYCDSSVGDCDAAYWYSLEISDAIPGTNNYTFEDDVLTIDLSFGNELVTPLTFPMECYGDKVIFESNGVTLYRIGSNCD